MESDMILFSGNSNMSLAKKIVRFLDIPVGKSLVSQFSDGETRVEIQQNVRGDDVFLVQPISSPANHSIMEALIMVDALKRASARHITLVCPYFGYARQERKSAPRTPITAKLVADLYEAAGVTRVLTLDLHTSAIQGFFKIPVDHLYTRSIFIDHLSGVENVVMVSPDAGGAERARHYAKGLNSGMAIIDKRRSNPNESAVMHIVGDVKDKNCIIVDDIVDTAGSLCRAADALMDAGATSVMAAVAHPVLSGPAVERINNSNLQKLYVTDSLPLSKAAEESDRIVTVSVAELLAKAIRRIHNQDSISSLFL